jgi:hypothetical protein
MTPPRDFSWITQPLLIGWFALMAVVSGRAVVIGVGWPNAINAAVFIAAVALGAHRFRSYLWELPPSPGGGGGKEKVCGEATSAGVGSRSHQEMKN